jgi:NitT/TauT family transport system substrate-binding protein
LSALRPFARLTILMLAVLLAASPAATAAERLRVAKPEATTFAFALLDVGIEEGIFAKHGLEIESLDFAGAGKAHQALIAGSVDVELGSGVELMFIAKGSPAKGIAVLAGPPMGMCITVRDDGEIKDSADLKGKLIGVSTAGSLTDWLATELSRRQGWGSDGVNRVPLGSQDALIAALVSKNVDAIVGGTQTGYRLQAGGRGKVLTTFGRLVPDFITHMILASDRFIASHPDTLRSFLAGWFETVRFVKANKAETIRVTLKLTRLPPEIASTIYDEQIAMLSSDGRFQPKPLEIIEASVRELGGLKELPADTALFTEAFLPPRR